MRAVPLSLLFLAGAFSQAAQAVLAREMLFVFGGNELGLGIFFAAWLFWVAAGAWACGSGQPARWPTLAALLGMLPAAAAAGVLIFRLCPRWMGLPPGQAIPLQGLAFWAFLALQPVGSLVGAVVPAACRDMRQEGDAGLAYAWDAAGGLLGGFLFVALIGANSSTIGLLSGMAAIIGIALLCIPSRVLRGVAGIWIAAGSLGAFTQAGGRLTAALDALRWQALQPKMALVAGFDTPYQNFTVARAEGVAGVFADGRIAAEFPSRETYGLEAALFFAQDPKARNVLLIEGAAGGLLPELLRYPVERIDCVEPDERGFELLRAAMPPGWAEPFKDPRVRLHFADTRSFMRHGGGGAYDIIAALGPDPATARANRLFTQEFYRDVRARLVTGGIYVAKMTSAENYSSSASAAYGASIYATLSSVFGTVLATPGDVSYLIAGDASGLSLDPLVLEKRIKEVRVTGRTLPSGSFQSLLPRERVSAMARALKEGRGERNTDSRPVAYYLDILRWGRLSGSEWVSVVERVRSGGPWLLLLPLCVFILMRMTYALQGMGPEEESRSAAASAMAGFGLWAMAAELMLLFEFQNAFGSVYQKIGLLNGLFMAGLAAGSIVAKSLPGSEGRGGLLMACVAVVATAFISQFQRLFQLPFVRAHESTFYVLALLTGSMAGAGFPLAVNIRKGSRAELGLAAGVVGGAEHIGGVAGALATGGILVPLFGIEGASRMAGAGLALLCLPLLQSESRRLETLRVWSDRLGARLRLSGPYRALDWSLVGLLLAAGVLHWRMPRPPEKPAAAPSYSESMLVEVGGPGRYEAREKPFPHYARITGSGKPGGAAFGTMPLAGDIEGYGGPLHLLMAVSEAGRVLGVRLIESRETPAYIEGIEGWLNRFRGLDGTRPIRVGVEIDALTGATVTSEAAARIVDRYSKAAADGVLGLRSEKTPAPGPGRWAASPRFWVLAVFLAGFFPVFFRGGRTQRLVYLAGAVAVLGFYANTLFTLVDLSNLSEGHVPGLEHAEWLLVAGFIAVTSLLWGAVYCGSVCPFGALQELLWEGGRRLGLRSEPGQALAGAARTLRLLLLTGALCMAWATGRRGWTAFEPMQHIFLLKCGTLTGILIAAALAGSAVYFRFWCRFLCPTGAFLALANKLALARAAAPARDLSRCAFGVRSEFDADCIQCRHCCFQQTAREDPGESRGS